MARAEKPYTDPDWLREHYVGNGESLTEMADACDVTFPTIIRWMDKHGIERRDRSEWARSTPPHHHYHQGYETVKSGGEQVKIHQLVAIANGADPHKVFDGDDEWHVHHSNNHRADNRPSNIEFVPAKEHGSMHGKKDKVLPENRRYYDGDLLERLYVEEGKSTYKIAEELPIDITAETVRRWLSEHGIDRADRTG